MTVTAHQPVRPTAISRTNPLSRLGATLILSTALVISVDPVSAGVALGLELAVLPFVGVPWQRLRRLLAPVAVAAVFGGFAAAVFGVDSGTVLTALGPLTLTTGSVQTGLAMALRVMAIALPGVALVATTDPTDLADALAQRAHLPHRFVLGALAGMRLLEVLAEEWQVLSAARRARGVRDRTGPVGTVRVFAGQAFALLVMAIRRATRLAAAMEGRGFGAPGPRTWARTSTFHPRDGVLLVGAVLLVTVAIGSALAAGTWSVVWW